ncbi:MAG: SurA N-terminal domain-containing protein [Desulfuromonadales bacterium]|nr:SurA N-terminal domain-containing protein [Desulfuromonadales bacterium]
MLDFVRNKQKSILIKLAFAIIILSFVIGYAMLTAPGGPEGDGRSEIAATVNGEPISYADFQTIYSNYYQLYQNIYQDQFTPALEKQLQLADKAINGLIDQVLLRTEAEKMGIAVSKQELIDSIAQIQAFQENGSFSRDRYLQVLAYQRLTADQFEAMQRDELLVEKVRSRLQEGITVSAAEIDEEYRTRNDTLNLAFVRFSPVLFEEQVVVDDAALETYFAEHQETFRTPEKVAIRYLQFVPERYADQLTFSREELERYYRRHLDQFEIVEQVRAAHILVKLDPDAGPEARAERRRFAEELLDKVRAGEDFAELARAWSDDKASAVNGGDLDYFSRGSMVPEFERAAFNMQPGDISDLVETGFGYHIIKVDAYIEPGVQPLDEAIDTVRQGLRAEKAGQLAFEKAMDAYNINRKSGDLQAAAEVNQLGIKESGLFARDGVIDGIGANPEVIAAAFALEEHSLARPIVTVDGVLLIGLKERVASHIPQLDEVRDMVTAAYRRNEAKQLAGQAAEQFLEQLRVGANIDKLARKMTLEVETTGDFTRSYSPFVPRIGTSEELAAAAFALGADETLLDTVFTVQNRFIVAVIKERRPADLEALDEATRSELHDSLLSRKQTESVQQQIDSLRAAAVITIAPRVQALLAKES